MKKGYFVTLLVVLLVSGCTTKKETPVKEWSTVVTEQPETIIKEEKNEIHPQKTNVKDAPDIPSISQIFQIEDTEDEWTDLETTWRIHVLDPTDEDLDIYIQACIDFGFSCNANMNQRFLYAETEDGQWYISVKRFEANAELGQDLPWAFIELGKLEEPEVSITEN